MPIVSSIFKATLSYGEKITATEIAVKYDGISFNVVRDGYGGYGNAGLRTDSFSTGLPFYIINQTNINNVYTSTAGNHTIEISVDTSSVETTKCFKKAVRSISGGIILNYNYDTDAIEGATWQETYNLLQNGAMVYLYDDEFIYPCTYFGHGIIEFDFTAVDTDSSRVATYRVTWNSDGSCSKESYEYPPGESYEYPSGR